MKKRADLADNICGIRSDQLNSASVNRFGTLGIVPHY